MFAEAPVSIYNEQPSLFSAAEQRAMTPPGGAAKPKLTIPKPALESWKQTIQTFQQRVRGELGAQQVSLFEAVSSQTDASAIDPFGLEVHNFFFFQWPSDRHPAAPCIYFVIDTRLPLLLYVGETCRANQRWKGVHDCKQYVLNYQALHFQHQMPTTINTAFWWDTPEATRPRQRLELDLITRWKSPFNKENWRFWGTPFIE
ncbi:MAG: GIY-YIG nuclease family protein [Synechococcales bacterium]|nr:GIY-YIG nuclease family protein [Synechococcales bacterium]